MKKLPVFFSIFQWLGSRELFARPSKQLPGRWMLYEYYSEPGDRLINLKEEQLKNAGLFWDLHFKENGSLGFNMNLPVQFFDGTCRCNWYIHRNFITVAASETANAREEFQYAVDKGSLKLLKKAPDGRIEFFGFFRKVGNQ